MKKLIMHFALGAIGAIFANRAMATEWNVSTVAALTNAVTQAMPGDKIILAAKTYTFTDEWMDASGTVKNMLVINAKDVTIEGEASSRKIWTNGSEPVIIDANGLGRIVYVNSGKTGVTFKNIAFTGGVVTGNAHGGGVYGIGDTLCTNCVFRGNSANGSNDYYGSGGAEYNCILRNCLVSGSLNRAALRSGTAYGCDIVGNAYGVSYNASLYDCVVSNNVTASSDSSTYYLVSSASASPTYSNCVFRQNVCGRDIVSSAKLMIKCVFDANTNRYANGILFEGTAATNCTFRRNRGNGGNSYLMQNFQSLSGCVFEDNSVGKGSVVLNTGNAVVDGCTFASNNVRGSNGGAALRIERTAASCKMTVTNCTFSFNSVAGAGQGGAIYAVNSVAGEEAWGGCTVFDSTFTSNTASSAAGVYGVRAVGCTFDGNLRPDPTTDVQPGNAAAVSRLEMCDLNDGNIFGCIVDRCRIHDIPSTVRSVFSGWTRCTNSLIERCELLATKGTLYHIYTTSPMDAEFVNCTFVTNKMHTYYIYDSNAATNGIKFVNCLFNGNIDDESHNTDFGCKVNSSSVQQPLVEYVSFDHSYYGKFTPGNSYNITTARFATVTNSPNSLMLCEDPRFAEDPEWSLSLRSKIFGSGNASIWTDLDVDLAGKPRLRDGMVDPGCFQCWLRPLGMMIFVR